MKKRVLALLLGGLLALSLCACGGEPEPTEDTTQDSKQETAQESQKEEAPTDLSKATLGNYDVEIKDAFLAKDYEGNPAIVVNYTWTNNSEDTTSAMVALIGKAFQDGVQLETAITDGSIEGYDAEASMKEMRPGTTQDFQEVYVMTSETSPVEVEMTEAFTLENDMVTKTFDPTTLQ